MTSLSQKTHLEKLYATHGDWTKNPLLWSIYDNFNLLLGLTIMVTMWPYLIVQMGMSTLWDLLDKKTVNLVHFCQVCGTYIYPYLAVFTRHPADGFMVVHMIFLGIILPAYFFYEMHHVVTHGFSMPRAVIYNLIRIGPQYVNFMNVYVMCHKEAHLTPGGIFKPDSVMDILFSRVFNHWVGMFHGLVPGGFTYSHLLNHHKYDNDYRDIVTTAYRPRDSFVSFIKYMPDWFYYSCNLTTWMSFFREHRWTLVAKTTAASAYHLAFVYCCYVLSGRNTSFLFWFIIYPYFEANILLSIVNFVWHAFIDPREPHNDFVNSTTIVNGANFTLQEEYHVVHHLFPGIHWTRHEEMFTKQKDSYFRKDVPGSIVQNENIFVVFIYMVTKNYSKIADLWHDPDKVIDMKKEDLIQLIKTRLQCHGHDVARACGKTHKYDRVTTAKYD